MPPAGAPSSGWAAREGRSSLDACPQALSVLPVPIRARRARGTPPMGLPESHVPGGAASGDATTLPREASRGGGGEPTTSRARGGEGRRHGGNAEGPAERDETIAVGGAARRDPGTRPRDHDSFCPIGPTRDARRDPRPSARSDGGNGRIGPRPPRRRDGARRGAWLEQRRVLGAADHVPR